MDNQYVRDLAKNVKDGLRKKADKGHFPGRPEIGYRNSAYRLKGEEKILVDKVRFPMVRKMWEYMLTGNYSPMEVWRIATHEWKLTTHRHGKVGGKPIPTSYIYRIFKSIFYTGHFRYAGTVYKGSHAPMVTMNEFEKVQRLLGGKDKPRPILHEFPYTGIMKCGNCGASITASERTKFLKETKVWKTYTYYHCTRRKGIDTCNEPQITLMDLENNLKNYLLEFTICPEFYKAGLEVLEANKNEQTENKEIIIGNHEKYIKDLESKLAKLLALLLNETITEVEYNKQKLDIGEKLLFERTKLQQVDSKLKDLNKQIKDTFHFSLAALHALENGDIKTRKSIMKNFGSDQRILQKNLYAIRFEWFSALKEGEKRYLAVKDLLGLRKPNNTKGQTAKLDFFSMGCSLIEDVRMELSKVTNAYVPDLSFWANDLLEKMDKENSNEQSLEN